MSKRHHYYKISVLAVATACFMACTNPVPVQEMSNARQTLQAAKQAQAQHFAPGPYEKAQVLLEKAAKQLNSGDYYGAKVYAVEAQLEAGQAHRAALISQKSQGNLLKYP